MKLLYKNSAMSYKIVLKSMKLKAEDTVMIDDVRDFLICAKNVGMKTILVNKNIKSFDLDYSIENIYDLEKFLKKFRDYFKKVNIRNFINTNLFKLSFKKIIFRRKD